MQTTYRKEYKLLLSLLIEGRKKAGIAQAELAKKLKTHQSFVSKYENGERRLEVIEFVEIADLIGADYNKLAAVACVPARQDMDAGQDSFAPFMQMDSQQRNWLSAAVIAPSTST